MAAISEAVCRYRDANGIDGPLFLGPDTHALSEPASRTAMEVLAVHGIDVVVEAGDGFVPTPVVSHDILAHNPDRTTRLADGIVVTPSHNPPEDGGHRACAPTVGVGKTVMASSMTDRAAADLGRRPVEVPVGFKWFVVLRRGERRRVVPTPGRLGLDGRQGRADPLSAGGGADRPSGRRPGRTKAVRVRDTRPSGSHVGQTQQGHTHGSG